jgi:hypothetical protein
MSEAHTPLLPVAAVAAALDLLKKLPNVGNPCGGNGSSGAMRLALLEWNGDLLWAMRQPQLLQRSSQPLAREAKKLPLPLLSFSLLEGVMDDDDPAGLEPFAQRPRAPGISPMREQ